MKNRSNLLLAPGGLLDTSVSGGGGAAGTREPGAVENRLSLDPSDSRWPELAGWNDGDTYSGMITIEQVSPGEFQVTAFKAKKPAMGAEEDGEPSATDESTETGPEENPALKDL